MEEAPPPLPIDIAPLGLVGWRYLEAAARPLAAIAVLIDRHACQLGEYGLRHLTHLRMVWRYGSERTAVAADNEGAIALLKFCEPAQLVKDASG